MKRFSVLASRWKREVHAAFRPPSKVLAAAAGLAVSIFLCAIAAPAQTVDANGWVVLPVEDYRLLRRAAFPADVEPVPPPVEATLSRIDYDLKVDGDLATGEARLTVDVVKDGWVRLEMPAGLMIREAHLDGKEVSLVTHPAQQGPGTGELLLSHTGRSVLSLSIVAPVTTVAGTDLLQLPVSNSAVSHATVVLARQGVDVRITGGMLLEKSETAAVSRWVANGRGHEPLTFAWRRKIDDQRATQALRFRGALTELVGLGEDATQISAEVQVEVLQGDAPQVRLQLPPQFAVNQVSGAVVADWDTAPGELTVTFIEPVQQTTRFTISGEIRLPRDGKLDIPLIRLPAAERETGGVAVEVLGAGEIKERHPAGLEEAEAADLGQLISSRQSPSLIAFRLSPGDGKSERSLSLGVARYTPQAVLTANVEEAEYNALVTADGKMLVQARFAVRNNQRNFVKLNLPSTSVLWSASVAGRPIRPGKAPDGSLLLPLEKMKTGDETPAFVVEVSYMDHTPSWADKGHLSLSLPAVDLPISKSRLLLHHSPLFKLTPLPGTSGSFRVASYEAPETGVLSPGLSSGLSSITKNSGQAEQLQQDAQQGTPNQLVTRYHESTRTSRPARNLPLRVTFPHFGPSVFMLSELTSENQTPVVEIDFQRGKKRGER
jgi:hypothetical protein